MGFMRDIKILLFWGVFSSLAFAEEITLLPSDAENAGRLQVTVRDADGQTLPCCLSLIGSREEKIWGLDATGNPLTYRAEPRLWISGDTIICVTADTYRYVISRPFRFLSHTGEFKLPPGKEQTVSITMQCIVDMPAYGWYGGDAHQHVVHGEREFAVDTAIACRIARSEGADWSSFNSYWSSVPGEDPTLADVRSICKKMSDAHFRAYAGDEYPKDHLGHMTCIPGPVADWIDTLGVNEYSYPPGEHEAFAHFEILRSLHRAGGISVYTHPVREYGGSQESPANIARELPFDILAAPHLIPSVDWMTDNPHDDNAMKLWSMYLDWGYQIGVCAFTDTCFDRRDARPFHKRTYVYLGKQKPTSGNIISAIRRGHTFGTTGPLMRVDLDGNPPGTVFPADGKECNLKLVVYAAGVDYFARAGRPYLQRVEIVRNGKSFLVEDLKDKPVLEFEKSMTIAEDETAWYIVKAFGSGYRQVAVSSPFYFRHSNYVPPKPVTSTVSGKIYDADTGKILDAVLELIEYGKTDSRVIKTIAVEDGSYKIECPPVLRLRAKADGYRPQIKSVFFDEPAVYRDLILPLQRTDQLDPDYYRRLKTALQNVTLDFLLQRE